MKWTTLSKEQLHAERQASAARRAAAQLAKAATKENPQFAGLHLSIPRYSIGQGCYVVSVKKGRGWL